MPIQTKKAGLDAERCPVAWFCELEIARQSQDFERAAYALKRLRDLGVDVKFRSSRPDSREPIPA